MAKETDKKVLDLIKLANQKKEAISKAEKPQWKTNCSFGFNPDSGRRINIQVEADVSNLTTILGFLMGKADEFKKASEVLGLKQEFKWMGFTLADWRSDIQTRVAKIQITSEKRDLETIEKRLSGLISPELRAQLDLEEIEKMLAK